MSKRDWAQAALETLQAGQRASVEPRGHSMQGKIDEGDSVVIVPCHVSELKVGDSVLARIRRRRHWHLVLHQIIERNKDNFLIGNNFGRLDGWITAENIFGKVHEIGVRQWQETDPSAANEVVSLR